jgi:hypothetical protein
MRTARSDGFILTLVILALGMMGVMLLVLTTGTQTMLSQTDRMYLSAVESNLISSGTAWASTRLPTEGLAASDQSTQLDAGALSDRPCSLSVRLANRTDSQATLQISTSCGKAKWTLTHSRMYEIPAR